MKKSFDLVTEQNKRLLNFSYIISHNLRSHTSNIESIVSLLEFADTEEEKEEMMQLLKTVSMSLGDTMDHLNEVININTQILNVIRNTNPTRFVIVTGGGQSSYLAPMQLTQSFLQSDSYSLKERTLKLLNHYLFKSKVFMLYFNLLVANIIYFFYYL